MNERIRKLRKFLNLSQTEFGNRIGVKQGSIASYESGARMPLDSIIVSICREFNVNKEWLETGEGEMFVKIPEEDETAALVFSLLGPDKDSFHSLVIEIMKAYNELSPTGQETICNFVQTLCTNLAEKKEG